MGPFWQRLRQGLRYGRWLTADRARSYSLILLGFYACATIGWILLSNHWIDRNGKPIGTDFSSFYAAGSMVLEGRAGDVYDMAAHFAREQQLFGAATPYYGWLYPPIFLLIAAPLALLPYPLALCAWQGASFAFYLVVIAAILRKTRRDDSTVARLWLPVAAAFPAVFINLGHGQNGFLTAALLGAALVSLQQRPILSGILFGLLAYKPQFGLLIPFALLAGGQWRSIVAAAIAVIALAGLTTLTFGGDIWWLFAATTETSRKLLLEQGDVGFEKLQSVFAAIRMWGGTVSLAYAVQAAASLIAIGGVLWTWRSPADQDVKAALLIVATLLGSPHVLDYDLTILAPAIAFLVAASRTGGVRDYDVSLMTLAWITPLIARAVAGATGLPLGLLAVVALYAVAMRRATQARTALVVGTAGVAQA